jgi:peroxiredoxin
MSDTRPPAVGEIAPDFAVLDATGTRRRSADLLADRPLVLVFYRGHW